MTLKTAVCIRYKFVEGWHVFQSDDVPGLYVANMDARRAFDDVGPSIKLLMKLNEGVDCEATPALPFSDFVSSLREEAEINPDLVMSDKRFILTGAVA